jgi:hypothetical protein
MPSTSNRDLLPLYAQQLTQTVSDRFHRELEQAPAQLHHRGHRCHSTNPLSRPDKRLFVSLHADPATTLPHRPLRDSHEIRQRPPRTLHTAVTQHQPSPQPNKHINPTHPKPANAQRFRGARKWSPPPPMPLKRARTREFVRVLVLRAGFEPAISDSGELSPRR